MPHPEYQQLAHGKLVEHRVRRRRHGSPILPAAITALAVIIGSLTTAARPAWIIAAVAVALVSRWGVLYRESRCFHLTAETVTPIPNLGLQLSTASGLSLFGHELQVAHSKRFVALSNISTVVINEGLVRWGVRYYLAVVGQGVVVAFEVRTGFTSTDDRTSTPRLRCWKRSITASGRSCSTSMPATARVLNMPSLFVSTPSSVVFVQFIIILHSSCSTYTCSPDMRLARPPAALPVTVQMTRRPSRPAVTTLPTSPPCVHS